MTTVLPSVCGVITISLHGAAAAAHPKTGGEYRATGDWSAGRPVFSNGVTYLYVVPGGTEVGVADRPDSGLWRLRSGCVTWCPASPRATFSHRDNQSSWEYYDKDFEDDDYDDRDGWRGGDIRVTCETHQH